MEIFEHVWIKSTNIWNKYPLYSDFNYFKWGKSYIISGFILVFIYT
jgi:hypothetical protein